MDVAKRRWGYDHVAARRHAADGNINTPHGGKTADAAESEEDDGSSKLIAKES